MHTYMYMCIVKIHVGHQACDIHVLHYYDRLTAAQVHCTGIIYMCVHVHAICTCTCMWSVVTCAVNGQSCTGVNGIE